VKTYGKCWLEKGQWHIETEPHVALKLKRVFPKIKNRQHGVIKLTNTEETCRDIEWFLDRYPLEVDAVSLAALTREAGKHRERETLVSELLSGIRKPREFDLALPPREYQKVGADMCIAAGGLLLADDLGLGKTLVGICVASHPAARPALVVTLTHLPRQWEAEFKKFAPQLRTHILKSGKPYDLRQTKGTKRGQMMLTAETPDVIITNYHKLAGWAETLAPIVKSVIFDEGQELRHPDSAKASAAKHIAGHCNYRLSLTATPIYNYGDEIFSVIDAVRPGALGSRGEFIEEWCSGIDNRGRARIKDPAAFGTFVRDAGLMLRRTRAEVGRELPDLIRIPHHVDSDTDKLAEVDSAATELAQLILSQNPTARGEKFRAAEELSNLVRQATGIAKAPYVAEFVKLLIENGESVVLYAWHREVYTVLMDRLKAFNPVMYTGSESPNQKEEARRAFIEGESKVLVMSLRAGAGLDGLQHHAHTVVFGELDWSPGVHDQCAGRLHRDGQTEPVVAYYLIADSGSDPIVADVLGVKAAQAAGIRDPNAPLVTQLQNDGDHVKKLAEAYLAKKGIAA
jgi:SNF2 family DNA or RNA helicase